MSDLGDLFGAGAVLLFIGLGWALENWRFVLAVALGLWGLFLLSELSRGFEHVSAQLAAVNARLGALQDAAAEGNGYLGEVRDHLLEIERDIDRIETHIGTLQDVAAEGNGHLQEIEWGIQEIKTDKP